MTEQDNIFQLPVMEAMTSNKSLSELRNGEPFRKITFDIEINENDVRARQFACRLFIQNNTPYEIDILAINYRLGFGVTVERSENTSSVDLNEEYDRLRRDIKYILRSIYITNSEEYREEYLKNVATSLRNHLRFANILHIYYYIFTFQYKIVALALTQQLQRMDFPLTSAGSANDILRSLADKGAIPAVINELLLAKIQRMAAIEQVDRNFLRPEYVTQIVPGESFERIYILKASRKISSRASYTAAFDIKLSWIDKSTIEPRAIERVMSRSASFDVTPSPVTLSIVSIIFSFFGTLLNSMPYLNNDYNVLLEIDFVKKYFVAAILALVIYNSLEMTDLKDRIKSISWRSAMFIGMLCGLLSDKMLKAIISFVQ